MSLNTGQVLPCTISRIIRRSSEVIRLGARRAVMLEHHKRRVTTSGGLGRPPFGSRFPLPRGSRGRPPHTLSRGHPPVAPRGVGNACRWVRIARASPPAEGTGNTIVGYAKSCK